MPDSTEPQFSALSMTDAYRYRLSRMNPQEVLQASRTAAKMLLDARDAYKKKREAKMRYEMGPYESTEMDMLCRVIDLLEAAGYFAIDGALKVRVTDSDEWQKAVDNVARLLCETEEVSIRNDYGALTEEEKQQYRGEAYAMMIGTDL